MNVTLNGKKYELAEGSKIQREVIDEFGQQYRTTGQQARNDRAFMSSWELVQYQYGFGISRMRTNIAAETQSFWDSTVDTRNPRQVILPPLRQTTSLVPSQDVLIGVLEFDASNLYTFNKPGATLSVVHYNFFPASNSFGSLGAAAGLGTTNNKVAQKNYIPGKGWVTIWRRGLADWSAYQVASVNTAVVPRVFNAATLADIGRAIMKSDDSTQYFPAYDQLDASAQIYTFSGVATAALFASQPENYRRPPALERTDGKDYAGFSFGLYEVGSTVGQLTRKVDKRAKVATNTGANLAVFNGDQVMIPDGLALQAWDESANTLTDIGPNLDDGLPAQTAGGIKHMRSTDKYLFAALREGTADEEGYVLAWDGVGWHYFGRSLSVGLGSAHVKRMLLTNQPDGVDRMWLMGYKVNAIAATIAEPPMYWAYPLSNPLTEASYTFATQGKLILPENDFGLPEYEKGFYDIAVDGRQLGAGNQIEVFYGVNGAAPSTSLGIATVSGVTQLKFGGGVGTAAKTIQPSFVLTRGTAPGTTPQLVSGILHYLAYPAVREAFNFVIDVDKTSRPGGRPAQTVLNEIASLMELSTMVPFYFGHIGTRLVKVTNPRVSEEEQESDTWWGSEIQGALKLRVVELL